MRSFRILLIVIGLSIAVAGSVHAQGTANDPSSGCSMKPIPIVVPTTPPSMDPDLRWGQTRLSFLWSVMDRFLAERTLTTPAPVADRSGRVSVPKVSTQTTAVLRRVR